MKYDTYKNAGIIVDSIGKEKLKITNCTAKDINGKIGSGILYTTNAEDLEIENCHVENLEMANMFGGIVNTNNGTKKLKMTNCTAKNMSGDSFVGGMILNTKTAVTTIERCNVEGINIGKHPDTYNATGVAGIATNILGNSSLDTSCIIKDCTMKNMNVNGTFQVSGIAKSILGYDSIIIQNCDVDNITTNLANQVGGILCDAMGKNYNVSEYIKIENCNAKNMKISNSVGSQHAGIVAYAKVKNADIQNCGVANVELTDIGKSRYFYKFAGIAAYIGDSNGVASGHATGENMIMKNCIALNVNENENRENGATVGIAGSTQFNNTTIENCKVEKANMCCSNSAAGVLFGAVEGNNVKLSKCIAKDSNIKSYSNSPSYPTAGIVGCISDNENAEISKSKIENIKLDGEPSCTLSGIIGAKQNELVVDQCKVNNLELNGKYDMAGIIANPDKVTISNCELSNITLKNAKRNSGGAVAVAYKANISNTTIDNINITNEENTNLQSSTIAGGIIGKMEDGKILNCNVNNIKIKLKNNQTSIGGILGLANNGQVTNCLISNGELVMIGDSSASASQWDHLGGIAGFSSNIQSCTVENTKIDSSQTSIIGTGGIAGHSNNSVDSVIKDCKVIDSEVTGKDATGGICGAAVTVINGCTVENSKITATGKYTGGIQGYGGYRQYGREKSITIENCNVNNTAIKGTQWVDYFQGRNSHKTDSDTDTTTEDKITNCNYDSKTTKN